MQLLAFLVVSAIFLVIAYRIVGAALRRMFSLSAEETTPAFSQRDGVDFEPIRAASLLPQHFSAIAAAGPVVGPILAGLYFGWGPTWIWLLIGSVFVGGVHDFTALIASVRHRGRTVAELVREYMNPRAYLLFMMFVWFALIYVIVAFVDVTASTFVAAGADPSRDAPGPAVATSSMIYLLLALAMGMASRFLKLGEWRAKPIFLPLVAVAIWAGPHIPLDLHALVGIPAASMQRAWGFILLAYCFAAALVPVWLLLQPRGELGGYFLYVIMIVAVGGIAIGAFSGSVPIVQPFFSGWSANKTDVLGAAMPLFPILFITVACGACSGFHSIVASGTTSRQLRRETDAVPVAYGSMLLEAFFACISLATFMVLADPKLVSPDLIYAEGLTGFSARLLSPFMTVSEGTRATLLSAALLCFATFVFDTLDACTRLARYVLMEFLGWTTRPQAVAATAMTLVFPAIIMLLPAPVFAGKPMPLWKLFWTIFGSSNQLLAALTLLSVSVWLARKGMAWWIALVPAVFMLAMTIWSLILMLAPYLALWHHQEPIPAIRHLHFAIALSLIGLGAWLLGETGVTLRRILGGGSNATPATASS